ncbi:hypothetical protein AB0O01_10075 [Streptomyces sp. NPDC093252]|uniref:hypothetical protein n=1 Tax=Streptomyces sp. NPDC093252 TaxID=3154980 RepID=UPI00343A57FE
MSTTGEHDGGPGRAGYGRCAGFGGGDSRAGFGGGDGPAAGGAVMASTGVAP